MSDFFDDYEDPDFWDWAIIFRLSEDIAREKQDRDRIRREWDDDEGMDYWEWLNHRW